MRLRSASALWRLEGNAAVVLPILSEAIKSTDGKIDEALGVLDQLGPAGAPWWLIISYVTPGGQTLAT